jgi:hypothetical protein
MLLSKVVSVQLKKNVIRISPLRSEILKPGFCVGLHNRRVVISVGFYLFAQISLYVKNSMKTGIAKVCRGLYFFKIILYGCF